MEVDNNEYIYYINDGDNIKLEDFKKLLENDSQADNLEKIISIFFKKMKKNYIDSFKKLIDNDTKEFIYPATLLLVSCLDVIAKYYYGSTSNGGSADNYQKLIREKFKKIETITKRGKTIKKNPEFFYKELRCGLTHSNSTNYKIGFEELKDNSYFQYIDSNTQKVNIKVLCEKIVGFLFEYETILIKECKNKRNNKKSITVLNKFLAVLKKNYI